MAKDFNLRSVIAGGRGDSRSLIFGTFKSESVAFEVASILKGRIQDRYRKRVTAEGKPFPKSSTGKNWIDTGTLLENITAASESSTATEFRARVSSEARRNDRPEVDYAGYVAYRTGYMGISREDRAYIKEYVTKRFGGR